MPVKETRTLRLGAALPALLFAATLAVYLARPLLTGAHGSGSADTLPTRLLPVSLLTEGNFDLDEFFGPPTDEPSPYYLRRVGGHHYSTFPVGAALLLTPLYVALNAVGVDVLGDDAVRLRVVSVVAAVVAALSVLVIYGTYAARGRGRALAVALLYGFGTGVWPLASQDVWQHTFGLLLMSIAVWALERGADEPRRLAWVGLAAGLLFFVRPPNAPLVVLLAAAVAVTRPRALATFALLSLPFLAVVVGLNGVLFGHPFGGNREESAAIRPLHYLAEGLPGLLVSPARGLVFYAPAMLLGYAALFRGGDAVRRPLLRVLALMLPAQLLLYGSYSHWYGGYCFGPRFLLESMPACAALLWHAWPVVTSRRWSRAALATAALWSVGAQAVGTVHGWDPWCAHPDLDRCRGRLWDLRDNPLTCAVLGLPPHCDHALTPRGPHLTVDGVDVELLRGWSTGEETLALGDRAEMRLDPHGLPLGQVVVLLTPEPGLERRQIVTAEVNGKARIKVELPRGRETPLVVPLERGESAAASLTLTLHFTASRRRSVADIRPVAAELKGVLLGFWERSP